MDYKFLICKWDGKTSFFDFTKNFSPGEDSIWPIYKGMLKKKIGGMLRDQKYAIYTNYFYGQKHVYLGVL